jgi:hypothetical protein
VHVDGQRRDLEQAELEQGCDVLLALLEVGVERGGQAQDQLTMRRGRVVPAIDSISSRMSLRRRKKTWSRAESKVTVAAVSPVRSDLRT